MAHRYVSGHGSEPALRRPIETLCRLVKAFHLDATARTRSAHPTCRGSNRCSTPRDDRDRQTRRRIADLAEEWRRTAAALPFWEINDSGPELVLVGKDLNQPVATMHGMWAPNLARYLTAMDKTAGVSLAELLWTISSGTAGSGVTKQAVHLLQAMGLERRTNRYRPR